MTPEDSHAELVAASDDTVRLTAKVSRREHAGLGQRAVSRVGRRPRRETTGQPGQAVPAATWPWGRNTRGKDMSRPCQVCGTAVSTPQPVDHARTAHGPARRGPTARKSQLLTPMSWPLPGLAFNHVPDPPRTLSAHLPGGLKMTRRTLMNRRAAFRLRPDGRTLISTQEVRARSGRPRRPHCTATFRDITPARS